ncbi:MAG: TIGR04282 family arsenosugar biosynthesis glycosyltransferase [bacterium]|nr:TIGR04282 family arsenosugar biosynthesis glycosyltransferase [bacterium]
MADHCVLLFVKYPEKGEVKSRLTREAWNINIVELYKNFVLDLLISLNKIKTKFYICFYPENSEEKFIKWLGGKYLYMPQKGQDLGDRMKNCFIKAFSGKFKQVIVIGSDAPDMPCEFIKYAFASLDSHDAVIGPASDGGYYLLGFNFDKFVPEIFEGIEWSTDKVFKETLSILNKAKRKTYILPEWNDIDVHSDLVDFVKRNKDSKNSHLNTYSYLSKHNEI